MNNKFADMRHNNSTHHSSLYLSGSHLKPGQMEVVGVISHRTVIEPRSEKAARAIIAKMEEWLEANQ